MNIHDSVEDYLEAILKLRENHGMVRSIDIVREQATRQGIGHQPVRQIGRTALRCGF